MTPKRENGYIRERAKKLVAIKLCGSKCKLCGESRHWVLDFHHNGEKTNTISFLRKNRWSILKNEIKNCILLCANCHAEKHTTGGRNGIIKSAFINEHDLTKCENCGYDKCIGALDFHHKKDKTFGINQALSRKISVTPQELLTEVDKCAILCRNCHRGEHFDFKKYKKYEKQINEKSKNLREIQPKIDRHEVKKMLDSGMKQIEIARHFNASKGTISGIVKELKK